MAKFLTTASTTSALEDIINKAQHNLVFISPYIKIPNNIYQNLITADSKGIKTTLIYGKKIDIDQVTKKQLNSLSHISVYFLENLHAKCYFNEESMIITSMNLYDFSEKNNREMGILLTRKDDTDIYMQAFDEYKRLLNIAQLSKPTKEYIPSVSVQSQSSKLTKNYVPSGSMQTQISSVKKLKVRSTGGILSRSLTELFGGKKGYCIRCRARTDYDLNKPFCTECYPQIKHNSNIKPITVSNAEPEVLLL